MKTARVGRRYKFKTQVKGFLSFLICMSILFIIVLVGDQKNTNIPLADRSGDNEGVSRDVAGPEAIALGAVRNYPKPNIDINWDYIINNTYGGSYPTEVARRREFIIDFLSWNYHELSGEEINNLVAIAAEESTAHDPLVEPKLTFVQHCKPINGKWYADEINPSGGQYKCREGEIVGRKEKSIGVFQILPTTWEINKCSGNILDRDVVEQIDCAVKIYKKSGYGQWRIAAQKLGLI